MRGNGDAGACMGQRSRKLNAEGHVQESDHADARRKGRSLGLVCWADQQPVCAGMLGPRFGLQFG